MKKLFYVLFIFVALLSSQVKAQKFFDLDKSPMDVSAFPSSHRESNKIVKVIYSRPKLKGRKLSKLAPEGKVWRTGANEAAEIIFYKDVLFGDKPVKAGRYSLFTIPNKNQWTVILNSAENVWGAYFYRQDEDIVRVNGTVSTIKKPIQVFSIGFDGEENNFSLYLGWANTIVAVPITVQ